MGEPVPGQQTVLLAPGDVLTVTFVSAGDFVRLANNPGGGASLSTETVAAGGTAQGGNLNVASRWQFPDDATYTVADPTPVYSDAVDGITSAGVVVKITETVTYDQFTDGGGAAGTYAITKGTIPQGAEFLRANLAPPLTGFAGDTSATIQVGDGTVVDRYSTGTPDVFSDVAGGVGLGAPSGTTYHAAEKTVTVTITSGSDWGLVTAGAITLELFYLT